jgi:hypothetical protein
MDNLILAAPNANGPAHWAWCNLAITNGTMMGAANMPPPVSKCWALN